MFIEKKLFSSKINYETKFILVQDMALTVQWTHSLDPVACTV